MCLYRNRSLREFSGLRRVSWAAEYRAVTFSSLCFSSVQEGLWGKRLLLATLLSFGATSVFAQGSIQASAQRAVKHLVQAQASQAPSRPSSSGRTLKWTGFGLIGAGVAMIVLANTMPKEQCVDFVSGIGIAGTECVTSTNAPLAWASPRPVSGQA